MQPKLKGVFVIAGGSRGFSRVLAMQAYKRGYPVALIARTKSDLTHAKREIENSNTGPLLVTVHVADLTDPRQTTRAFEEIKAKHRPVAVLVNNAATWTGGKILQDLSREEVQRSLDLNFFTAFNSTKALLGVYKNKPPKGLAIINMGATASLQGWDGVAAFCLGKGALRIFSQALAREQQKRGVHVAHLVVDGLIGNTRTKHINPRTPANRFIGMEALSNEVFHIAEQDKSCWTFETDVRPFNESW